MTRKARYASMACGVATGAALVTSLVSRARRRIHPASTASVADTVTERVRALLGRQVSYPRVVDVEMLNGNVILRGPILASEADRVIAAVLLVRGVESVDDRFERHESADTPALQGGVTRPGWTRAWRPADWSPTTRAIAGTAAVAGAAVALSATVARARRRRLEAELPPPF